MKKLITLIMVGFCFVSLCFASPGWDNTLPADSSDWDDAAGMIRDNWDALETAFGEDLVEAKAVIAVFNVTDATYGAEGNGSTDDITAINAAITAANAAGGGVVFFPEGTYLISSSIIPKTNVTLRGEEGSIIYFTGINAINSSAAVANLTIERLIFNGRLGASTAITIDDATSTFIKIQDCEIENCGTTGVAGRPINIKGANNVWILNNNIHDCRTGIAAINCNMVIIKSNFIKDIGPGTAAGEQGIMVWATSDETGDSSMENIVVSDNIIEDISDNGVRITAREYANSGDTGSISGVTVDDNIVKDAAVAAFKIHADNVSVTNNIAIDAGRQAFVSSGGENFILANNIAVQLTTRTASIGVAITWAVTDTVNVIKNVQITGNMIYGDEWEGGIWCYGDGTTYPQGILIADNTIVDVGTATPGTATRGITVNYWYDVAISDNYLDNTYEGISSQNSTDITMQNNRVVNCVDGSGRGIRTATVTRAYVSGNYLYGNTLEYELDSDDTKWVIETEQKIVDVTATQIKALAATQKELVPAPGANKYLEFVSAILILDDGATNYDDAAGDGNMVIRYVDGDGAAVSQDIEGDGFIDATADTMTNAIPKKDAIVAASASVNKALVLDNDAAEYTTGDGVMQVIITYRTHTSLGL